MKNIVYLLAGALIVGAIGCTKHTSTPSDSSTNPAPPSSQVALDIEEVVKSDTNAIVTVNGEALTPAALQQGMNALMQQRRIPPQMMGSLDPQMLAGIRQQAIEQFIGEHLIQEKAVEQGLKVTPEDIEAEKAKISERLPEGVTFEDMLARVGATEADFAADMGKSLLIRKLYEEQTADVPPPTDEEVSAFYEENKSQFASAPPSCEASHILLKVPVGATDEEKAEIRKKLEGIRQQIVDGADFAEIAKQNSDCPSAEKGGSLGSFGPGQMVKPFSDAAFSQEIGAIGEIVESNFGYHIIKVASRTDGEEPEFEELKERIVNGLQQREKQQKFMEFIEALKEDAEIVYAPGATNEFTTTNLPQ